MSEGVAKTWQELPHGVFEGANHYTTAREEVLTLWRDGQTWDIRVDPKAERIRAEALERVRLAFCTGGSLDHRTATAEDIQALFEDVMLAAEPGKAEYTASQEARSHD